VIIPSVLALLSAADAPPAQQRIGPAQPQAATRPWTVAATLDGGYDSNILIESSDAPARTDTSGAAWTADLKASYRFLDEEDRKAAAQLLAAYSGYPEQSEADLARVGLGANGSMALDTRFGRVDVGAVVVGHRVWLEARPAATIGSLAVHASHLANGVVDIATLGLQAADYDQDDGAAGVLGEASWRRWWMPSSTPTVRKRIEAGLRLAHLAADEDSETYAAAGPSVGALWRFGGDETLLGTWDVTGRATAEWRWYRDGVAGAEAERSTTVAMRAGAQAWLAQGLTAGPYLAYSHRLSDRDQRDYQRVQAGLRIEAIW
jgi:hypothetical protein